MNTGGVGRLGVARDSRRFNCGHSSRHRPIILGWWLASDSLSSLGMGNGSTESGVIHGAIGGMEGSPLYNADLAPVPVERRTWSLWHIAALWVGMAVCIPTYQLASGLIFTRPNFLSQPTIEAWARSALWSRRMPLIHACITPAARCSVLILRSKQH